MSVTTVSAPAATSPPRIPEDLIIVLLGASGDLAKRKLLPGKFHLTQVGLMPSASRSSARREYGTKEFREMARDLRKLAMSPRALKAAVRGPSAVASDGRKRKKVGAKVSFRLNEGAVVAFKVKQQRRARVARRAR